MSTLTPMISRDAALAEIEAGLGDGRRYSDAPNAGDRAAWGVVQRHFPHKSEEDCRNMIRAWVCSGVLVSEPYYDPVERKRRAGLRVDSSQRPTALSRWRGLILRDHESSMTMRDRDTEGRLRAADIGPPRPSSFCSTPAGRKRR